MASKRPHADVHPSRAPQVPGGSVAKKRKMNPHPSRNLQPKKNPVNPLKARIRSLNRLLTHKENLPADVRLNHERELASCKWELAQAEREQQKKDLIGKYHMIRFFERRKAERRVKKLEKRVREGEKGPVEEELHEAKVDLNYALYFPLDMAYSALWPNKGNKGAKDDDDENDSAGGVMEKKGDPDMWMLVEKCMEEGKLDSLRSGKLLRSVPDQPNDDDAVRAPARSKVTKANTKDKKKTKPLKKSDDDVVMQQDEDGDSDGGFFE